MAVVIDFCSQPPKGLASLKSTSKDRFMGGMWSLPDSTAAGDTGVLFLGGRHQAYVGTERIWRAWSPQKSGAHKGVDACIVDTLRRFAREVPSGEVEAALGIRRPGRAKLLSDANGAALLKYLRSRRSDPIEAAIEGVLTESRRTNRSRNPKLRAAKLAAAKGRCEACECVFKKSAVVDRSRVLTVHHRQQLSAFDEPKENTLDDLAVLSRELPHARARRPGEGDAGREVGEAARRSRLGRPLPTGRRVAATSAARRPVASMTAAGAMAAGRWSGA